MEKLSLEYLKKKPNKREKFIFGLFCLALVVTFFRSCYVPSTKSINTLTQKNNSVNLKIKSFEEMDKKKILAPESILSKDEKITFFSRRAHFTEEQDNISLLNYLTNTTIFRNLRIKDAKFSVDETNTKFNVRKVRLAVEGPMPVFLNYLENIESLPLLLILDKIIIKASGLEGRNINVLIEGSFYGSKD